MIKSVSRNGELYKNTNNIWVIYEYYGNNSFTESDVFELWDFIQQNKCFYELFILNVYWIKKYYISFFYGEPWYANNINNYDPVAFNNRYNEILNLKPKIEKLKMFEWKIVETNLKLYSFGKDWDNLDYLEKAIHSNWMNFDEKSFNTSLLKNYFPEYVKKNIGNSDYRNYILQSFYQKDTNFDFFNVDQAIFEPVLNFVAWNEFFLFPFYYSGITQKTGIMEYQTLNLTDDIIFLDTNIGNDYDIYLKKISISPKIGWISVDKKDDYVVVDWGKSHFSVSDIGDNQNMFFEINHSLFLYTKKPDVSTFLSDFIQKFWTQIVLKPKKVSKDFNEMYLSHNSFEQIFHYGHIKNIAGIMKLTKEYMKPNKRWASIWREYFSNNEIDLNLFDVVGVDPSDGNLASNANWFIIGTSGSWKTFFAKKFVNDNKTDQIIVFDNMRNFEDMVNDWNKDTYNIINYDLNFPNIIGKVTTANISVKQSLLYKIISGVNTEISWELKETIRWICNIFMESILWDKFKLYDFIEYVKTLWLDKITENDKRVFLNKVLWLNSTIKHILNNDKDIFDELLRKQKIILSYPELAKESDESKFFMLSVFLDTVVNYIADKKRINDSEKKYRNTIIVFDEAHNIIKWDQNLESSLANAVRQVRNYYSSFILISQTFNDFILKTQPAQDIIYSQTSFHFVLSPDQWELYKNHYAWIDTGWKRVTVFTNIWPQVDKIAEMYTQSAKQANEGWRTRFCIFGYITWNAYYIVNTNKPNKKK